LVLVPDHRRAVGIDAVVHRATKTFDFRLALQLAAKPSVQDCAINLAVECLNPGDNLFGLSTDDTSALLH
jgi:hypothetical protein